MADQFPTEKVDFSEITPCKICGKGVMHGNQIMFYRATVESCIADLNNIRRMHGLEMAMGGAAPLARALSPDNTVARRIPARPVFVCLECATRTGLLLCAADDDDETPVAPR